MYKKLILLSVLTVAFFTSNAQYRIEGSVTTQKNEPLEGVSISIKDSYYGATSTKDGRFAFQVADTGLKTIQLTIMGYKPLEQQITVSGQISTLSFQMKEAITDLKAVVITAGSFEAGDKKRTTVLKSQDVVTTAGQQADIVAALKTLPGAQQVGEQEGLFVRGGTGSETKVFIDGMMVTNPFFSSVPGIAQRARFSPLLFKGTVFSSGGYSAQYGQGLSSALILESIDLPARSEVNMIISSPQVSVMGQKLNKKKTESFGLNVNYMNLAPYYGIVKQKFNYSKAPEALNAELNYRKKLNGGFLKFYAYANENEVGFSRPSLDHKNANEHFHIQNKNLYTNATLTRRFDNGWMLNTGASFSYNKDRIKMATKTDSNVYSSFNPELSNQTFQTRVVLTKSLPNLSKLYIGAEFQNVADGIFARDSISERKVEDKYLSGFVESDIYYSSKLVSKVGLRYEYSSLLNAAAFAPRVSLAYKVTDQSQFSFAYGDFYQKPETNYLLRNSDVRFTKATHYILNYQRTANSQTFRAEAFSKIYKNLLTTNPSNPFDLKNEGSGYAKGLEIFWRDKKSIKNLDYWVAYSFLDTKRKYLDYSSLATPSFAAKHTVNVVGKRFVSEISTLLSGTYTYASGRPYYNPNRSKEGFMSDRTMNYHSLGLQANYLKTFGKVNAVFIANVSNALGSKQVFGYRYASKADTQGNYASEAITPMAKRFVFIGMYLSMGADRRKNILD